MIAREWLTATQLGQLYGVGGSAVKKWIYKGKFHLVKKVRHQGGGSWGAWLININDEAIDADVRDLWRQTVDKNLEALPIRGLFERQDRKISKIAASLRKFKPMTDKLQQIVELQQETVALLKGK